MFFFGYFQNYLLVFDLKLIELWENSDMVWLVADDTYFFFFFFFLKCGALDLVSFLFQSHDL